jgi:hypothetical protein
MKSGRTRVRFTGVSVERASARSNMASSECGSTVMPAVVAPKLPDASASAADVAWARRCSSSCR